VCLAFLIAHCLRVYVQRGADISVAQFSTIHSRSHTLACPLLHFCADPTNFNTFPSLHSICIRTASAAAGGFLLTAFSNACTHPVFRSTLLTKGASEKALRFIRQDQSSQLHGTLFSSISSRSVFTSFSSASLRRRSQAAQYQSTGCMSTQAISNSTQSSG